MEKALALNVLSNINGSGWDCKGTEHAVKALSKCASIDGLSHEDLKTVANSLCEDKLNTAILTELLRSLVPKTDVPVDVVSKVLGWVFSDLGKKNPSLERLSFFWFVALLQYQLCEKDILQKYYHDFFFATFRQKHLEISGCSILYYLTRKEDARKYIIFPLLHRYKIGPFLQLNALLSLLKSYRPDLVHEALPDKTLLAPQSTYDKAMQLAAERTRTNATNDSCMESAWSSFQFESPRIKKQNRLIPTVDYINSGVNADAAEKSVEDYNSLVELGRNPLQVPTPAQVLSLLRSERGFHFLAFAKPETQARFIKNLEHVLNYAFLRPLSPYAFGEKALLLASLAALEEFLQESISVVNKFLIKYLKTWDGCDYFKQIHALLEWFTLESTEKWENMKTVLRIYFRSADADDKCNMLRSLGIMLRNTVSSSLRDELNLLDGEVPQLETSLAVTSIGDLVSELAVESLNWSRVEYNRILLGEILTFYHIAVNAENAGDLPVMLIIPTAAVYQCLFSDSAVLIERLCSLLLKYQLTSERLCRLGVYDDFKDNFDNLIAVYLMDTYRILFGGTNFRTDLYPGIFSEPFFQKLSNLNEPHEVPLQKVFLIHHSYVWAEPASEEIQSIDHQKLSEHYPSTLGIKKFVEGKLELEIG